MASQQMSLGGQDTPLTTKPDIRVNSAQRLETLVLRLESIHKRFGGIHALRGVSFDLSAGEVHALVGENGAGKSTLIKILAGAYRPDEGQIVLDGGAVQFASPRQAQRSGIATIYQETSLYPDLSVLENLYIGHQPKRLGRINWAAMRKGATELFGRLGLDLPLRARLGDLGKARAQLVEIAKALLQDARILILDEPTAALTTKDADALLEIVRGLRSRGISMIYISHRLEELFTVADHFTVLRDGEVVGHAKREEATQDWLIATMVGRKPETLYPRRIRERGKALLEVRGLSNGVLKDVSFTVHEGEIVGMAGLVGSGRTEVARAIFGIDKIEHGTVLLEVKLSQKHRVAWLNKVWPCSPKTEGDKDSCCPFPSAEI
jgi:rhamnose transport system ATP-binding protein